MKPQSSRNLTEQMGGLAGGSLPRPGQEAVDQASLPSRLLPCQHLDCSELLEQPIFCFTADIDWASELAIETTLKLFDDHNIPLTPFITHESPVLRARYASEELKECAGLHPNFLPGSSHGSQLSEIIDHVHALWPEARGFRSHSFYDHSQVTPEMYRRGLRYDSNVCLWLQPNCLPLCHVSGLVRFPVFWEDDVHFGQNYPFDFGLLRDHLDRPGLKIINVHPIHVALNVPDSAFYERHKHLNRTEDTEQWRQAVHPADGSQTLLVSMLEHVRQRGYQAVYLRDLFAKVTGSRSTRYQTQEDKTQRQPPHQQGPHQRGPHQLPNQGLSDRELVTQYRTAPTEVRAQVVRSNYDQRDGTDIYATSRDFHLRELEISFMAKHFRPGKVLDLGCGNGYTLLSLARQVAAEYLGLDFSVKMLEGAEKLTQRFAQELKALPAFQQADVRQLSFADSSFDCVLSERCLLNLPCREDQYQTIREVHRVLKRGGVYLMVEGTDDGLERLNALRQQADLAPIPSVAADNISSLKFREADLEAVLRPLFTIETKHYFSLYYFISRVIHPLLAAPEQPRFDSKLNAIARQLNEAISTDADLGHVVGYKLIANK